MNEHKRGMFIFQMNNELETLRRGTQTLVGSKAIFLENLVWRIPRLSEGSSSWEKKLYKS